MKFNLFRFNEREIELSNSVWEARQDSQRYDVYAVNRLPPILTGYRRIPVVGTSTF